MIGRWYKMSDSNKKKVIDIGFGPNITYEVYREFIKNMEEVKRVVEEIRNKE